MSEEEPAPEAILPEEETNGKAAAAELKRLSELLAGIRSNDEKERAAALALLTAQNSSITGPWHDPVHDGIALQSGSLSAAAESRPHCILDSHGESMDPEEIEELRQHVRDHYPPGVTIEEVTTADGHRTVAIIGMTARQANAIEEAIGKKMALEKKTGAAAQDGSEQGGLTEEQRLAQLEETLTLMKEDKDAAMRQFSGIYFSGDYTTAILLEGKQTLTAPHCIMTPPPEGLTEEKIQQKVAYWKEHYPAAQVERVKTADGLDTFAVVGLTAEEANTLAATVNARDELQERVVAPGTPEASSTPSPDSPKDLNFDDKIRFYASLPPAEAKALMEKERAEFYATVKTGLKEVVPNMESQSVLELPTTVVVNGGLGLARFMGQKLLRSINEPTFAALETKSNLLRAGMQMQEGRFDAPARFGEPLDAATKEHYYEGQSRKPGTKLQTSFNGERVQVVVENKPVGQPIPREVRQAQEPTEMLDALHRFAGVRTDVHSADTSTAFLQQLRDSSAHLPPATDHHFVYTVTTVNDEHGNSRPGGDGRRTDSPRARNLGNYVKLGILKSGEHFELKKKVEPYLQDLTAITALPDGQNYNREQIAELQALADQYLPKGTQVMEATLKGTKQKVAVFVGADNQMVGQAMQMKQEVDRLETALGIQAAKEKSGTAAAPHHGTPSGTLPVTEITTRADQVAAKMRIEATGAETGTTVDAEYEEITSAPHCEKMQAALKTAMQEKAADAKHAQAADNQEPTTALPTTAIRRNIETAPSSQNIRRA